MLLEKGVCYKQCILLTKLLAFALLHFVFHGQTSLLFWVSLFFKFIFIICAGFSLLCRLFCSCTMRGSLSICHAQASHCGGFSCCRAQALGHMGFSSCSVWAQQLRFLGPGAQAHRVSCSMACGIFLDQGSNPCILHWQVDSLPLSHQGSPITIFLFQDLK